MLYSINAWIMDDKKKQTLTHCIASLPYKTQKAYKFTNINLAKNIPEKV
jgi:hypothetical protein